MKSKLLRFLLIGLLSYGLTCSLASASEPKKIDHTSIIPVTKDNPVVSKTRYKIRGTQNLSMVGMSGYSFFVDQADRQMYKDGSFIWLFIYAKHDSACRGDIMFEYNASNFKTQITEFCVLHGPKPVDFEEIPYIERTIGLVNQFCDPIPVNNIGQK